MWWNYCEYCVNCWDKANEGKGSLLSHQTCCCWIFTVHRSKGFLCSITFLLFYYFFIVQNSLYLENTGISVLCVCPGLTNTNMANLENVKKGLTFDFCADSSKNVLTEKSQTAKQMAALLVDIVEMNKNGSIWLCRFGTMEEIVLGDYEDPK